MTKNITISVPDDIANEMAKLTEVSWSAVARDAIEKYLERRKVPDIAPILERLTKEKDEEYTHGIKKAIEIATSTSYKDLDGIFKLYDKNVEFTLAEKKSRLPKAGLFGFDVASQYGLPGIYLEDEERYKIFESAVSQIINEMPSSPTTAFQKGLYDGLQEWKEKLKI